MSYLKWTKESVCVPLFLLFYTIIGFSSIKLILVFYSAKQEGGAGGEEEGEDHRMTGPLVSFETMQY